MLSRKVTLLLAVLFLAVIDASAQSEVFKNVVNNLALYKQKKDLKYLTNAKKSVDSLMKTHLDSVDLEKNVYKAVVYSSIVYLDSTNKLKMPPVFFGQVTRLVGQLMADKRSYRFQHQIDFSRRSVANVYLRQGFDYMRISDFYNAIQSFQKAKKFAPEYKELNGYIAYANNKMGNLIDATKYYTDLLKTDSSKAEVIEAASNAFKAIGDTTKALQVLKKGRRKLPDDKFLLLDEANIYNNKRDYGSLEPLLSQLLDENPANAEIVYIAANCYDHLNEFDKAESLYLRSIELNNSVFEPIYNLGLLYLREAVANKDQTKGFERSGIWLEKANEISPNDIKCLQLLQIVYSKMGNQDQLEKTINKLKNLTNQ